MSARSFLDTNVLVYTDDARSPVKQRRAQELFAEHRRSRLGVVSIQVLQEYFVSVTRKLGVDPALARQKVELIAGLHVVQPTVQDVLAAIDEHRLHGYSFWDSLVLRCAHQGGCSVVYSEDLQPKQRIHGMRIVNPFE